MSVFAEYSRYYDLLYRDKDYKGEADFVANLVRTHAPLAETILELGCGTGKHAELLARDGFMVHGVDQSEEMLADARRRLSGLPDDVRPSLKFSAGDIRDLKLSRKFDVVISLFHVMSYMTENADLSRAFATASEHLLPGGLFLFDFWYGPAVLSDPPVVRVKRLADDHMSVTRIAEPEIFANENCVDVNYEIHIRTHGADKEAVITERHSMRYLFLPEIDLLMSQHGMKRIASGEWMTGNPPGIRSWNVYVIGKMSA